ncbi:MAG: lamin tail domain-containing protein, partial [Bacteroidales bacterium]|nr:lamin tail domain-containing protein [Bacteroidales bacterium]
MRIFIISLLLFPLIGWCQLNDDFSDGDFTNQPVWTGDQNLFKINSSFQLQLNSSEAGSAYLSSLYGLKDSLEMSFSIRLAFSPSGSNNARVYLMSDNSSLGESLNGYFIQFGEALSGDAIELFHQEGTSIQSICRGSTGTIAAAFDINVKVTYSSAGNWNIFVDWDKNGNFVEECNGHSLSEIENPYFGYYCLFTQSNATKFYLDNVNVDYIFVDTDPPQVENVIVLDTNRLQILFDETPEKTSAETLENYLIQQSNQTPRSANQDSTNPMEIVLEFASEIPANQELDILLNNIKDLTGNTLENSTFNFSYSHAKFGDIIFNEIMADPSPSVELPEVEYLEIFNNASYDINLTNWKLKIGNTEQLFPSQTLLSGEYLILCNITNIPELEPYGSVAGFSSFSLLNSGQSLSLINEFSEIVDQVSYTDTWYQDSEKENGGWSLEKIQPDNICVNQQNWKASTNSSGGTPGEINSAFSDELILPEILNVAILNDSVISVIFNQKMQEESLLNLLNYSVDNAIGNPKSVSIREDYQYVELLFENKFVLGIDYQLTLNGDIQNCAEESLSGTLNFDLELSKIAEFAD